MTRAGGTRLKAAFVTAAAKLVRSKAYWFIAQNFVISSLRSSTSSVRQAAVAALGEIAHLRVGTVLRALHKRLSDSSPGGRDALVDTAAQIAKNEPLKAGLLLVALARDPAPLVALKALGLLIALSPDTRLHRAMAEVLAPALKATSDGVRILALELMARLPDKEIPRGLDKALTQAFLATTSADTRRAVLGQARRIRAAQTLSTAGQSGDPRLRICALRAAATAGGDLAATMVRAGLRDTDLRVRRAALHAAEPLLRKASTPLVSTLLIIAGDPQDPLQLHALVMLPVVESQTRAVLGLIREAASSPLVALREAAARALGRSRKAGSLLARLLRDPALEVRRSAVIALATRWAKVHAPSKLSGSLHKVRDNRQHRLAAILALHRQCHTKSGHAKDAKDALKAAAGAAGHPEAALLAGAALLVPPTKKGRRDLAALLDRVILY